MNLDQQIQILIQNAPQDGQTPKVVVAIAPVLKLLASQLQHPQYFICQSIDQSWLMTTLSNRAQPELEKNVVYAFPTLKDATRFQSIPDSELIVLPWPVTHILFQLFAMETVDSLVFFETPGNLAAGTEVRREEVQTLFQKQLGIQPSQSKIPPNIA
jgi:hypothetical protein